MDANTEVNTAQIERRHLTVLECDLVGSTALARRLDPEELKELLTRYQDIVLSWVERLDGYTAQFAGDAVWVYFGYPRAHEDDARRAVQAGLGMVESVSAIELYGESLQVRVGIASGLCVVGQLREARQDGAGKTDGYTTAIGEPPNLAARLQTLAGPGGVAVSHETRKLAGNAFTFEDLGFHSLKGFSNEIRAWRVSGASGEHSRFRSMRPSIPLALVGRDSELETLRGLWHAACNHNGQVVYLSGEAGIGKSRLVASVAEDVVGGQYPQWWLHCSEPMQDSAFAPVIASLQERAGAGKHGIHSLELLVEHFPGLDDEAYYLLAGLLSIESTPGLPASSMSASRRRERLYEVLIDLVEARCKNRPLLLVAEDRHWMDPSTQALLQRLILRAAKLPLLILVTSRHTDDGDRSFMELYHVHDFHLEALRESDCYALLHAVWPGGDLPDNIARQIVEQTDGVALYVEDVAISEYQRFRETGNGSPDDRISIPSTLQDHLMSRIDSLGESKQIAQVAAVIGRQFSSAMLEPLTLLPAAKLNDRLTTLVNSGLVLEGLQGDEQYYAFKHSLIQDAAYDSLLISLRKKLHRHIAEWLVDQRPLLSQARPELIARHYEKAGAFELAVKYWQQAGARAKSRSNYVEASKHLVNADRLLTQLEPTADRERIALDISMIMAAANAGAFGISSAATGQAYEVALQRCRALDYPDDIFPMLSGAASFHFLRANYDKVIEFVDLSRDLARKKSNTSGEVIGNRMLGAVQFISGDFNASIDSLQGAIRIYDAAPSLHRNFALAYSMDHKTSALCYLALSCLAIGELNRSLEMSREALSHSESIDLHNKNYALCYHAGLCYFRDDPPETRLEAASSSLRLALSEAYPSWIGMSRLIMGEAMIQLGQTSAGMQEIEKGVSEHGDVMAQTFLPFAQCVLARAYLATQLHHKALNLLIKAEALSVKTRQYWYLPEVQRLHAETLVQAGDPEHARNMYRKALSSAQRISAKFWQQKIESSMSANL